MTAANQMPAVHRARVDRRARAAYAVDRSAVRVRAWAWICLVVLVANALLPATPLAVRTAHGGAANALLEICSGNGTRLVKIDRDARGANVAPGAVPFDSGGTPDDGHLPAGVHCPLCATGHAALAPPAAIDGFRAGAFVTPGPTDRCVGGSAPMHAWSPGNPRAPPTHA